MKKFYKIILVFLLTGCSTINIHRSNGTTMIDDVFKDYTDRFVIAHNKIMGKDIDISNIVVKLIHITDTSANKDMVFYNSRAVAYCIPSKTIPAVYVDTNIWHELPDLIKEQLIFHELGHCVLRRPHCDYTSKGVPISLMKSSLLPLLYYGKYREYYHNELFREPACKERF